MEYTMLLNILSHIYNQFFSILMLPIKMASDVSPLKYLWLKILTRGRK